MTGPSPQIVHTSGVLGGEPRIEGHRIRVRDVVAARDYGGHTRKEIASIVYPHLTMDEIDAALAYYEDHRDEIAEFDRREREFVDRFAAEHPGLVKDRREEVWRMEPEQC